MLSFNQAKVDTKKRLHEIVRATDAQCSGKSCHGADEPLFKCPRYVGGPNFKDDVDIPLVQPETQVVEELARNVTPNFEDGGFRTRGLGPVKKIENRTTCVIHEKISFCPLIKAFVDSSQFQRLRDLKQVGVTYLTYMCAHHTRFDHSLGVYHLARKLCLHLRKEQPYLNITEKDILCVSIAALCHDLGHGPFSHVFDGEILPRARKGEEHWSHEEGSLMMLDAILRDFGLKVNEDPSYLDEPIDQIGDGIANDCFGVYSENVPLPKHDILTNRDMIFIKECILGKPLRSHETFIGRADVNKEFLYDIVSNRHNGLDVDKIDYFARDKHFTQGVSIIKRLSVLIHEAFVARVHCPHRNVCCLGKSLHLMICYPKKLATNVIDFFHTRFIMHQEVYTHKAHKGAEILIRDILLKADPHFEIAKGLSISRAVNNPDAFQYLRDSIIDLIEFSKNNTLKDSHALIARFRSRDLYKQICLKPLNDEQECLLITLSEDSMKECLLQVAHQHRAAVPFDYRCFIMDELIIELRTIHHGMKRDNPTNYCRFLSKPKPLKVAHLDDLPLAEKLDESEYQSHLPRKFQEISLMAFSRCSEKDIQRAAKHDFCRHLIEQWLENMQESKSPATMPAMSTPMPCSQNSEDEASANADEAFDGDYW